MCGRFILIQDAISLKNRFRAEIPEQLDLKPSCNISPGQKSPIITGDRHREIHLFRFGLIPSWSQKSMLLINARSEGDQNPTDDPSFTGGMGIFDKPAFRKPIRSQRCLVPADAYIEGTTSEKLGKPFLIYLRNKVRPFAFAGIWDSWSHPETGELIHSFAILTTFPNQLVSLLPHHRMPVILSREEEEKWLEEGFSREELSLLMRPYPAELMNGYPISSAIKNPKNNDPGLIQPAGPKIFAES
ncbi:MAG TPA: SOS response-associated peptidase [Prolixibacteraceae bacterium]|nr:SOS response-associated peptidase [Prolixibacteraceae bacterium]